MPEWRSEQRLGDVALAVCRAANAADDAQPHAEGPMNPCAIGAGGIGLAVGHARDGFAFRPKLTRGCLPSRRMALGARSSLSRQGRHSP